MQKYIYLYIGDLNAIHYAIEFNCSLKRERIKRLMRQPVNFIAERFKHFIGKSMYDCFT